MGGSSAPIGSLESPAVMASVRCGNASHEPARRLRVQGWSRVGPVRHRGSRFIDAWVNCRKARTVRPYIATAVVESWRPAASP